MIKTRFSLFLTMLLFIGYSCHAPSNVLISTEKWVKQENGRYKCELTNQYSTEQRRIIYPFDKAAVVLFIAYENYQIKTYQTKTVIDTTYTSEGKQVIAEKIIKLTYDPCTEQKVIKQWHLTNACGDSATYCAIESIQLNQTQIDSLSNILLNYQVKTKGDVSVSIHGCYFPRNTILFLDKTEAPIGSIEICFECEETHGSNEVLERLGDIRLCHPKLVSLKKMFSNVGIHYGVDER